MIKTVTLITGKTYRLFTSNMRIEVLTSRVHHEVSVPMYMKVTGARITAKVMAAIVEQDHTEALEIDAALEGTATITETGPSTDRAFNAYWLKCECMDLLTANRIWCQMRQEALEMNLNVINQQIRADAYNRPENRCLVDELHGYALRQNAGIDRAVEIIRALALDPCAGDAAGGCLYRDGHDDINYLVEVALRIVGPFMYMRPSATNIVSRTDGETVWWWSSRQQVWIKDKECTPDVFANIVATGNGFYCSNPEVSN